MCLEQPKIFVTFDHKVLALEIRLSRRRPNLDPTYAIF